jgi:membrane fusion protein, multidrug efflux system
MRPPFPSPLLAWFLPLAAALALAPACSGPSGAMAKDAPDDDEAERAVAVVTTTVKSGSIDAELSAASTIEAERMVTVHAESTGRLVDLAFEEGDVVEAGKVLGRIRSDLQSSGLDRASTSLAKAKADLDTAEALFAQKVLSKQELESARLAYKTATIDVSDRKRDVRNTKIVAPLGGTITVRAASEGGFVTSGAQIATIVDFGSLVARVYVPERELDRVAVGRPAEIVGKAALGRHGTGKVSRIAPVVDATTGTVKVTISLPRELAGQKGFLPGMYAEVTLTTESRIGATLVPKQALVRDDDEVFVFVLDDTDPAGLRARRTRVQLGLVDDVHAEIQSGVTVGAEIVESGHAGLKDGALVERVDATGQQLEPTADTAKGTAATTASVVRSDGAKGREGA